jgi:hypothetical protein
MGRPKGSKNGEKKDKLDSLPEEFRDKVAKMKYEEIDAEIAKIAKLAEQNLKNKDSDQDLAAKKEQATVAGEQYKANAKAFRLMQQFCIRVQKDKGRPAGTYDPTDLDGKESVEAVNEAANGQ